MPVRLGFILRQILGLDSKRHFRISHLRDLPFGVTLALESLIT